MPIPAEIALGIFHPKSLQSFHFTAQATQREPDPPLTPPTDPSAGGQTTTVGEGLATPNYIAVHFAQ